MFGTPLIEPRFADCLIFWKLILTKKLCRCEWQTRFFSWLAVLYLNISYDHRYYINSFYQIELNKFSPKSTQILGFFPFVYGKKNCTRMCGFFSWNGSCLLHWLYKFFCLFCCKMLFLPLAFSSVVFFFPNCLPFLWRSCPHKLYNSFYIFPLVKEKKENQVANTNRKQVCTGNISFNKILVFRVSVFLWSLSKRHRVV